MSLVKKHYFYVKVIEAHGIVVKGLNDFSEPFVSIKLNGHEYLHKKTSKYHTGVEWWEQTFRFQVKDVETDWVAVEVRDKGLHLFSSDWIGEAQVRVKDFKDGQVHEHWYKLGKGAWKNHTREPRGYIRLGFQLLDNKYDRPFTKPSVNPQLTFDEWKEMGMPMPGSKELEPTDTHNRDADARSRSNSLNNSQETNTNSNSINSYSSNFGDNTIANTVASSVASNSSISSTSSSNSGSGVRFELTYPTIDDAEYSVSKNAWKILMNEHPTHNELLEMKKLNRVNCLKKGSFDTCTGKRYMVCVDGTEASRNAFENCLKLIDPERDHLFVVTVRERVLPNDLLDEKSRVILTHKLWRAAAGIITTYMDRLNTLNIDYTTIMPEADDVREIVCALVRKYKADILVIGKHKEGEQKHHSKYFRSFHQYCQKYAKCSVMTF